MKYHSVQCVFACLLMVVFSFTAAAQTIKRNGVVNGSFTAPGDITFGNGSSTPVKLSNAVVDAKGAIYFDNETIIIDKATITCQNLQFGDKVKTIQLRGTVVINCDQLSMGKQLQSILVAGTATITCNSFSQTSADNIILKNDGRADFTLNTTMPLPGNVKFDIEDTGRFKTAFSRK